MAKNTYTAKDITVLEGLEPVRLRPGMYIGSTGARGLHHLVYEVVDNSVDEALAGRNERIEVTLHPDNSVTVRDFGSGIPVDVMAEQGRPALEVVLTKLHAGGKFGGDGYKVSGGLHGVGVSVVNALSEWLVAEVYRDGKVYRQEYERGVPKADMEVTGKTEETGTTITFLPDADIFEEIDFSVETLVQRLRETAFLTKGLAIVLMDLREGDDRYEFKYDGGIRDFVVYINDSKDPIHKRIVYFESESEDGTVEIAMQWNSSYVESVFSFANNINTHEGGSHLSGFKAALTGTLNKYARDKALLKDKEENLEGEDVREGLAARHLHQASRPAVRGPDEDEARKPVGARARRAGREREARRVPRGEPDRRAPGDPEGDRGAQRAPGRPEGAGAHTPQGRARQRLAPREARRLPDAGPGRGRALPRRGELRRRLGGRRARPALPGDPAAARQGHQLGEEPHQQGAFECGDPVDHHRGRHEHRRRVRPGEAPLSPRDRHDGRRRRRLPHPHADPHFPLPADARARRRWPCLHRRAAALPGEGRQPEVYIEKESQFEDLLVRERVKDIEVVDRAGQTFTFTEAKWSKFAKSLNEFDGWLAKVNSEFRDYASPANSRSTHRFVEHAIEDVATARSALPDLNTNGYELEEVEARIDNTFRLKVTERATSAANHVDVPGELFGSPSYGSLRKAYEKAAEVVGLPPFTITLGKKSRRAEAFDELRYLTLELAKEGIQVARFKGLGEMDPPSSGTRPWIPPAGCSCASRSRTPPRPTASSRC